MKIAFFALNQNFCGSILEELQSHHQVRVWKKRGHEPLDWANLIGLIDWCDLIYCDFIQTPCPEITALDWLDKPLVARMDGIDIMNHVNVDWRKVTALILMPVQELRLSKLRGDWEKKNNRRLTKLPKIIKRWNIGIDLDLFEPNYDREPWYEIVLHSSVMRETKRVYTALQVFDDLIRRDDKPWHLSLIGTWEGGWNWQNRKEYVMALHELIDQFDFKIQKAVIPGSYDSDERLSIIPNLDRNSWAASLTERWDVIWGPSFREGFPNSIGEGAASGVWPLINRFYGAELIYPEENICRSPIELMEKTIAWGNLSTEEKIQKKYFIRKHIEQYDRQRTARDVRLLCEELVK